MKSLQVLCRSPWVLMGLCGGHCTLFFSHRCSSPAQHLRRYIECACTRWGHPHLRALLLFGMIQWEAVTGNHSSKLSLKDGCYFSATEERQTDIQIQVNYFQIYATFPHTFCNIVQRQPGFRNEMYLIGFYLKWQHWDIFHNYVKSLSFVDFLPKEWKACYLSTVSARMSQWCW